MIDVRTLLLSAGLGLLPVDHVREDLVREDHAQEPKATQDPATTKAQERSIEQRSIEQWIADLGAESYRTRLAAEKALRELGTKALPALEKAAEDGKDPEVQWRARRLVRLLERGEDSGLTRRQQEPGAGGPWQTSPRPGVPESMQRHFEDLFERMERDFGVDIPQARFFQDDFFRDLKAQLPGGTTRSQGMSMQVGPDGAVRVEVKTENEKGETETKVYEAGSMADFEAQYPGVLQQNGLGMGLRLGRDGGAPFGHRWLLPPMQGQPWLQGPGREDAAPADAAAPPAGSRLGVTIRPGIPLELREHLDLEEGVGLMVESVQSGTLAEAVGLQRGDIVTKIAGQAIGSAQDVQKVLADIAAGAAVEVGFLRKGAAKTGTATKPEGAAPKESRLERLERKKPLEPKGARSGEGSIR